MQRLSHLAYIALGVVANEQPCTAYAVMRLFQSSSSSYFSGSAGAIYPLLKRLEATGLVKAKSSKAGSRPRRHYTLTAAGRSALKGWLCAPISKEDVDFTVDLLRARVFFFEDLSKRERLKFVANARQLVEERIENERERVSALSGAADRFERLATKSAIIADQGRLKWLNMLEREFSK